VRHSPRNRRGRQPRWQCRAVSGSIVAAIFIGLCGWPTQTLKSSGGAGSTPRSNCIAPASSIRWVLRTISSPAAPMKQTNPSTPMAIWLNAGQAAGAAWPRSSERGPLVVAAARSVDEHPERKPTVVQVTSAMAAIVGREIGGHDRGPARNQGETLTLTASKAGTWLGKASMGILWLPSPAHAAHCSSDPAGNSTAPCVSRPDR
jgi:hypothetical protein